MVNFGAEKASVVHVLGFVATFQHNMESSRLLGMGLGHFEPVQEESMPCVCLLGLADFFALKHWLSIYLLSFEDTPPCMNFPIKMWTLYKEFRLKKPKWMLKVS